jgi:hypothetical protein
MILFYSFARIATEAQKASSAKQKLSELKKRAYKLFVISLNFHRLESHKQSKNHYLCNKDLNLTTKEAILLKIKIKQAQTLSIRD